jgi:hypothetical protein
MANRESEPSTEEMIRNFIENRGNRYVLIGPPERITQGDAIIFDSTTRMVCGIDENQSLHRSVVCRMLAAGAPVAEKTSDVPRGS